MMRKDNPLLLRLRPVVWVLAVVFGLMGSTLQAQRSPRFDYFYMEAAKSFRNDEMGTALELFSHCMEIDSTAAEALFSMSVFYLYALDEDSVGVKMLEEACRRDSANTTYLSALAKYYVQNRDTEKVAVVLERLARLRKNNTDVLGELVTVYRTNGQNELALATLDRMELIEGISQNISIEKSDVYEDMGKPDSARAELERLCAAYPREVSYKMVLAAKFVDEKRADDARRILEEVQRDEPHYGGLPSGWLYYYQHLDWPRYLQVRDSILFDKDTDDETKCMLLEVYNAEAANDSTRVPMLLAAYDTLTSRPDCSTDILMSEAKWLARKSEDAPRMAAVLQQVLDKEPGNALAMRTLLFFYLKVQDDDGIEDIARRGVNFCQGDLIYPYFLASALLRQDKEAEVIPILEQGLAVRNESSNPEMVSDAFALLGDMYHSLGRLTDSFAAYDSSLVYKSDNISCLNNYAYFLSLTNERLDEAEDMSYRTVVLEPRNAIYLDTYAWILFQKGKYTEARVYINRAADPALPDEKILENEGINGNILEHAGDIHACCGDMELAMRFWKLAAGLDDGTCTKRINQKIKKRKYLK